MKTNEINAVEMVRAIRDRMYEETRGMSREQYPEYIRRKAEGVLNEAAAKTANARPTV